MTTPLHVVNERGAQGYNMQSPPSLEIKTSSNEADEV